MKMISYFVLLATLTACARPLDYQSGEAPSLDSVIQDFQDQLQADLEDDNILGSVSAAIIKGEDIIWSKAYGVSDRSSSTKADSNTIFRVGSVTKSFTAVLMMQLEAEGLLDIEEPVEHYFPAVKQIKGYSDSTRFSFRQLAAHTAGLQREPDWEDAYTGPIQDWEEKLLACIPKTAFQSKLGEKYSYSNIGYGILGLALSKVAGKSYIELVQERIFKPLGMKNSYFVIPVDKMMHLARGMEGGPFGELNLATPESEHQGRGYKVPNGAIYSTPNDLARFLMACMGYHDILDNSKWQFMQKPGLVEDENWWQNYGLGFRLLRDTIISTAGHTGAVSGYTANFMFEKEQEYGVVIMRNYNWGMTNVDLRAFALLRRLRRLDIE
ncbi:MAG: beta-lactamase family protein [Saprospiraceae bacterium]|nr:beta-lactamase family protein [Saprospiraceae bacterium]